LVDVTIPGIVSPAATNTRVRTLRRLGRGDAVFRAVTKTSAIGVLIILGGIFASLIWGAVPALQTFGFDFFVTEIWNPVTDQYGALAPIAGTLITSFLALLVALPVGLGIAIFLTELCPRVLRRPIGIAIELLAGVPSIIYGIWGVFVFGPFLRDNVQPYLISAFGNVPIFSTLFSGPPLNFGVLTASLVLAIMVLPFITAVSRDVFETVPVLLKESAYGVGCTTWEVIRSVVIPYTRIGLLGGAMLALGRALGETMAVTFVIGNADRIKSSLLAPGTTISAKIANEFAEADIGLQSSALVALGLILFIITFIVLAFARLLLMRLEKSAGS
jgi:phosphate transport system permease protein